MGGMSKTLLALLVGLIVVLAGTRASAAVSVYLYSGGPGFGSLPDVTDPAAALDVPDGTDAVIPAGGFIAFYDTDPFTTIDHDVEFSGVTGAGTVRFYVGRSDGVGGFTALRGRRFAPPVGGGSFTFSHPALTSFCTGLGGCDVFVIQAGLGTSLALDSAIAHNPEPSAWALMISGFIFVGYRLKTMRADGELTVAPDRIV